MSCFSRLFGSKDADQHTQPVTTLPAGSPLNRQRNSSLTTHSGDSRAQAWSDPNGQPAQAGFALPGSTEDAQLSPKAPGDATSVIDVARNASESAEPSKNDSGIQILELEDIADGFMVTDTVTSSTPKSAPLDGSRTNSSRGSTPSQAASRPTSTSHSQAGDREAGSRPLSVPPTKGDANGNGLVVDWLEPEAEPEGETGKADVAQKIRWKKGELLGVGAFGKVYLGLNLDSGELMAVKVIPSMGGPDGDEYTQELVREITLMKVLFNEHIVRYIGTEHDESHLYIFLEYVPGGSIASVVHKFGKFGEGLVRAYTRQILVGLMYLHEHQIMHRDIKGANILISNDGIVKLADFGASKRITEMMTQNDCMSLKGTPYWMAPEVIMQSGHGRSADIWSVGCTVIEMISGKPPFSEFPTQVSVLFHIANTQDPPAMPPNISDECRDFLLQTFQRNPRDRPTAATLLQHPFVMRGLDSPVPNWEEPKEEKKSAGTPGGRASPEPRQTPPPQTDAPTPKSRAAESINDTLTTIDLPPAMVGTPSGASGSAGGTRAGRHVQGFGEAARVVKEHRGDKIADEQVVKDYLYQQVGEQEAILEGDFRHSLKLLTNKSKKSSGRPRNVGSPGHNRGPSPSPSPQGGSPPAKRRVTPVQGPDYGALGTPDYGALAAADIGGVALGEKPIQSAYAQAMAKSDIDEVLLKPQNAERAEKERLWQEELERERRYQAEERAKNGGNY